MTLDLRVPVYIDNKNSLNKLNELIDAGIVPVKELFSRNISPV